MAKRIIQTYVFFDLETTGLPQWNCLPNITEISMVAVSRRDLLSHTNTNTLPRVLHKLLLPINPTIKISKGATKISGLSNEILGNVSPFNSHVYSVINYFLHNLTKPVCLLAHNGNRFDYPVLLKELKSINEVLSNDILTIDTLTMFRTYYKCSQKQMENLLNDGCDEMFSMVAAEDTDPEQCNADLEESIQTAMTLSSCEPSISETKYTEMQRRKNEKTPESQILKVKDHKHTRENNKVRRSLNFGEEKQSKFSYTLSNIYKYMFQTDPDSAHTAEGDCLTLLRCVSQISEFVVNWADENSVSLNSHLKKT